MKSSTAKDKQQFKRPSFFWKLIELLGSLKLAMLLLMTIAIACAAATVTESKFNSKVAYYYVYNAPWFNIWLSILCINLLCSALTRWPWQRKHIGFVVTHGGIILLLIGAMIGRIAGFEGSVTLEVGKPPTRQLISLRQSILLVQNPLTGELFSLPFEGELLRKKQTLPLPDHPTIRLAIEEYSEELQEKTMLVSDPKGSIALLFRLTSPMVKDPIDIGLGYVPEQARHFDFFGMGRFELLKKWPDSTAAAPAGLCVQFVPDHFSTAFRVWRDGKIINEATVTPGQSFSPGWINWNAQLLQWHDRARVVQGYELIDPAQKKGVVTIPGLKMKLVDAKKRVSEALWIASGTSQELALENYRVKVGYGLRTLSTAFGIELEKFEAPRQSGSEEPENFISHVRFSDSATQQATHAVIEMNHPASYPAGWWRRWTGLNYKFSQAGWDPNHLNQTTLQVLYDPGWFFKWTGSLMIVAGIFTMFYLKPASSSLRKA